MQLLAELQSLENLLERNGIRAWIEPKRVKPPGAWIAAQSISTVHFGGCYTATVDIYLIAPSLDTVPALKHLTPMLSELLAIEDIEIIGEPSLAESVALPVGGDALPAFKITTTIEVST